MSEIWTGWVWYGSRWQRAATATDFDVCERRTSQLADTVGAGENWLVRGGTSTPDGPVAKSIVGACKSALPDEALLVLARRALYRKKDRYVAASGKAFYWSKADIQRLCRLNKSLHAELFGEEK